MNSKIFKLFKFDFPNSSLIEASAGTGKTYTISTIYLRLILGNLCKSNSLPPMKVKEILVVTFTEFAVLELKNRIKKNIKNLYFACKNNFSQDTIMKEFLMQITDRDTATEYLKKAMYDMHESSIYTIHSFCWRILNYSILDTGILFKYNFLENEQKIKYNSCIYFWKKYFSFLPKDITFIIRSYWKNPDNLLKKVNPFLYENYFQIQSRKIKNNDVIQIYSYSIKKNQEFKLFFRKKFLKIKKIFFAKKIKYKKLIQINIIFKKIEKWIYQYENEEVSLPKYINSFFTSKEFKILEKNSDLFKNLYKMFQNTISFKDYLFTFCIEKIKKIIKKEKKHQNSIGYDDLISILKNSIYKKNSKQLIDKIKNLYPIAMIDEFQDTSIKQYQIFKKIYQNSKNSLVFIGDPKQSIYSFRGANILTYLKAKSETKFCYTLDVNWRTSKSLIKITNFLFRKIHSPFVFHNIFFKKINFLENNKNMHLFIKEKKQPDMYVWTIQKKNFSLQKTREKISENCAKLLKYWINAIKNKKAYLHKKGKNTRLKISDIVILVKNYFEAEIVSNSLNKFGIFHTYTSIKKNVFHTQEAKEILSILQTIVFSKKSEFFIKKAMCSEIFNFSAYQINRFNLHKKYKEKIFNKFSKYKKIWKKFGILALLKKIIFSKHFQKKCLKNENICRKITNILHIGEILERKFQKIKNFYSLLVFLKKKIQNPEFLEEYSIRPQKENGTIRILTIHKSKGLEFPIVLVPFAINLAQKESNFFESKESYKKFIRFLNQVESFKFFKKEKISEEIRLFYVAITRAIYHCSIGILKGNKKNTEKKNIKYNQKEKIYQNILKLHKYFHKNVSFFFKEKKLYKENSLLKKKRTIVRNFFNLKENYWRINSYSSILKDIKKDKLVEKKKNILKENKKTFSQHTFPLGRESGVFLHTLLEKIDFSSPIEETLIEREIKNAHFSMKWLPMLKNWMQKIQIFPLKYKDLTLNSIKKENLQNEFEFCVSIHSKIKFSKFEKIIEKHNKNFFLFKNYSKDFYLYGIIKGFIDLLFFWKKKYYILDYKSNWLGKNFSYYNKKNIQKEITLHRYDLQCYIYTIAIHRFLKNKLIKYSYKKNFGGVFYLFIRGIRNNKKSYALYFKKPKEKLINEINNLLYGRK
ncbi:exodeoxyribonuclease V subunit beta [bacterium endosymbiont of Pedicinus badii]|uniref:exodeoxyribonuclease V subunit beta n=1 Tax=bacterium endosymbiont of Pedicinus badii TaxID=1719126 RepID=UPI0009BA6469|nr:exodeoxyribonuclease V subunit beta [bacterium endosymbiont of Pedicinus badii]OQM34005.1 hypothetical protein AOQ89_01425 [bacterium endosymbiont of Pedicinus badii]